MSSQNAKWDVKREKYRWINAVRRIAGMLWPLLEGEDCPSTLRFLLGNVDGYSNLTSVDGMDKPLVRLAFEAAILEKRLDALFAALLLVGSCGEAQGDVCRNPDSPGVKG